MYNLDKRKLLIIKHLIDYKRHISSETLASVIGSNGRTIRDDLKEVDAFLRNFGAGIESKAGMGYAIRFEDFDEYQTFMQVFREKYADDSLIPSYSKERIETILRALLLRDWVKTSDLTNLLYISNTTFSADIKVVRALLKQYHLELLHKPNYGFSITGEERHIRVLLSDYLYGDEEDATEQDGALHCSLDSKTVQDTLVAGFRKHRIHVSANNFGEIVNLIVATAVRHERGFSASLPVEQAQEIRGIQDTPLILNMLRKIWPQGPEAELDVLALYIQSRRVYGCDDPFSTRLNADLYMMFDALKTYIAKCTDARIIMDNQLRELIPRVLKSLLLRVRFGYECRGIGIIKAKQKNRAFGFAALICRFVGEQCGVCIPETEIVRFAHEIQEPMQAVLRKVTVQPQVICLVSAYGKNGGLGYRKTLLDRYADNIKTLVQREFYEIDNRGSDFDILVTDIPKVKFDVYIPVFQIKHGLNERERRHLRALMNRKQARAARFVSCFDPALCFMGLDCADSGTLLRQIAVEMERQCGLTGFYDDCVIQDGFFSAERGNNAAVVHSLQAASDRTHIAVAILKRPILWNREMVSVVFVVAPGREDKVLFESVTNLGALITDIDLIHTLRHVENYEDMLQGLREAFERNESI